jgi:hypothetical protein
MNFSILERAANRSNGNPIIIFLSRQNTSKITTDFLKTQAYEYVLSRKEIEKSECGFIASFL